MGCGAVAVIDWPILGFDDRGKQTEYGEESQAAHGIEPSESEVRGQECGGRVA